MYETIRTMPKGYPGTGPYAGRRRQLHEPPRRGGVLSKAEQNLIDALVADQPSDASESALARQVDRLARVLRRSPAAVPRNSLAQRRSSRHAQSHMQISTMRPREMQRRVATDGHRSGRSSICASWSRSSTRTEDRE